MMLGELANIDVQTYIGHVLVSVNPFRDRESPRRIFQCPS